MERNIYLEIEYLGINYFGFQIQSKCKKQNTIQAEVESALLKLFCKDVRINYAGRTDRGVHAKAQAVNFKVNSQISLQSIKSALNSFLPSDIYIKSIKTVSLAFHARFSAKTKIYRYIIFIQGKPSVFWNNFSWHISDPLNIASIQKIAKKLIGKRDFSLFAREAKKYPHCVREIMNVSIKKRGSFIYVDIEASGFLRNMARNIVAFLVKVGKEQITIQDAESILKQKIPYINHPAPPGGLYLQKVRY